MGWFYPTGATRKDLIEERVRSWETEANGVTVTSTCLAHRYRGNVSSAVLCSVWERTFSKDGEQVESEQRWIVCDLLRSQRDYGWGYKDMEESMHPYYYSCPQKYLNLVPLDQYGGNAEWREQVRQHHQRQLEKRRQRRSQRSHC